MQPFDFLVIIINTSQSKRTLYYYSKRLEVLVVKASCLLHYMHLLPNLHVCISGSFTHFLFLTTNELRAFEWHKEMKELYSYICIYLIKASISFAVFGWSSGISFLFIDKYMEYNIVNYHISKIMIVCQNITVNHRIGILP